MVRMFCLVLGLVFVLSGRIAIGFGLMAFIPLILGGKWVLRKWQEDLFEKFKIPRADPQRNYFQQK
jgi:hypothetical protein